MSGTLYGIAVSPHVARTLVVAYETGVHSKLKQVLVNVLAGDQFKDPVASLNPFSRIPVYVSEDGSAQLFESRAIARYFDAITGGKLGQRDDLVANAKIEAWISVENGDFANFASPLATELFIKPKLAKAPTDEAVVNANKPQLLKLLEGYEKHFQRSKSTYLVGEKLTLADLFHLPYAHLMAQSIPGIYDAYPLTKAWYERLAALPSWNAVLKDQVELLNALGIKL